ncbi:MAG: LysR family transcriptional regulator [Eubacterium sp.]|nr:LysR family transcriptional regulator [Eubacterium sp.]
MNLNQLEYFISVAETLNFTRAAAKCFISQTAMTQQIRSLEKTVGVPLFIRDKHHVELTAAGKVYLNEARIILNRSNEALRMARLASEGLEGELTIGFVRGYGQSDFSEILRGFCNAYPTVKINLVRDNMSVLLDLLVKRECDLTFTVSPFQRTHPELDHIYIKSYPVMAVLYDGHPLAGRSYLKYEELEGEKFIMMQPTDRPRDQMEESMLIYDRGGFLPDVAAVEGDQETLLLMISVGMGISILPEYIIRHYQKRKDIRILPMVRKDGSAETVDLEVNWSLENENPVLEKFLMMLK